MKIKILSLIWVLVCICGVSNVEAQFDQERFGKNRIQHKNKDWYFFTSNNFEVYYYDGGQANARMAIDFLEGEFDKLTQSIGYVAYTKPKIFIYNSKQELLQSNLNLNVDNFTVDGQTFFSKLLAEVAYTGSWESFKNELVYNTSKIIIEEMLYGSSISDAFQSNLINNFPDWFIDGAAMYFAYEWSREMDDFVRHYLKDNENPKLFKLQDEEAGLVGQSIWNFIVQKYGRRYISSILNLSRINRNEENSIANTLGRRFRDFKTEWQDFYTELNTSVFNTFKDINEDNVIVITPKNRYGAITGIRFSPDGKHLAYVINNNGKYRVKIRDLSNDRERVIFKGGYSSFEQEADYTSPAIAWRDTMSLVIGTFKRGVTTLRMRTVDGSSQDKIFLRNITQILSIDFSSNGQTMVLSAINNGKTDIYTLNMRGQGRRLTNDIFDNKTPIYINDSTIVYASNKADLADSLLTGTVDVNNLPDYFNLFKLEVGDSIVNNRLTNVNHVNIQPRKLNSTTILHLSEQSGIMNVMRFSLGNNISSQVSAFNKSLEAFDYNLATNKWAYAVRDGRRSKLVLETFPNMDQFTPSTPRIQLEQAKLLNERISNRRIQREEGDGDSEEGDEGLEDLGVLSIEADQTPDEIAAEIDTVSPDSTAVDYSLEEMMMGGVTQPETETTDPSTLIPADTTISGIDLEQEMLGNVSDEPIEQPLVSPDSTPSGEMTGAINMDRLRFERQGGLDTDNYVFDTIPALFGQESSQPTVDREENLADRRSNILDAFRQQSMVKRVQGPRKYVPQFLTSSLNTSFVVDPLRGFGMSLNGRMTDLLDNHSIK